MPQINEQATDYQLADLSPVLKVADAANILLDSLPVWLSAQTRKSAGRGRSADNTRQYGVQKLRELILELAVRGKLEKQDQNNEPASILLEKIVKEKARLVKTGEVKKPRTLPSPSESDIPFSLPNGWEWTQIENIGHDWGQETPTTNFTYIDVASIDNVRGVIKNPAVLSATNAPSRARKIIKPNTILYSTIRPYLQNIAVIIEDIEPKPIASTAFAIVHPMLGMSARFFLHYFRSPAFIEYVESVQTGIAYPAINDKQFFAGLVPVPPLAEQHRIVKKVDELMALCDQLEQQQTDAVQAHETLVKVLLDALTQSENAEHFQQNWRRIAEHFDTLFTTESSIDQLKQTLLQLAIMGKLVPQDPNDEPASILLEKIAQEKARLVKEGKIKKPKLFNDVAPEEQPYLLPTGWQWVRLGLITEANTGFAFKSSEYREHGMLVLRVTNINSDGTINTQDAKFIEPLDAKEKYENFALKEDDVLLVMVGGSLGKIGIIPSDILPAVLNQNMWKLTRFGSIFRDYFVYGLKYINNNLLEITSSTHGHLAQGEYLSKPFPLPPLAEQNRIVQKVDELMALCDQLKDRLNQAQSLQQQLADTVVDKSIN